MRRAMVSAVRRGVAQREVARRFGVTLHTVQRWVARAGRTRLDRVDWRDRPAGPGSSPRRTPPVVERAVLALRRQLREISVLGEYGAAAIHRALREQGRVPVPAPRTIARILARHGAVDRRGRVRRPAPPPGWHLPSEVRDAVELDHVDVIEDLKLEGGPLLDVLTAVSLHGGLPGAWPVASATTTAILPCLEAHWQRYGRPHYAQFDNDTRFQGPHQHPDVFGQVVRFCLQLRVTPVFVPPYEFGLQNAAEHFNGLYTAKVWRRFHFASLDAVVRHTEQYLAERRARLAARIAHAPARAPWPSAWEFIPRALPASQIIFIRRTSARGRLALLGHEWLVDPHWCHRLVRAEVDLRLGAIRCVALRRREPDAQPLLAVLPYHYPRGDLTPDPQSLSPANKRSI
jgi:transposase-like protein